MVYKGTGDVSIRDEYSDVYADVDNRTTTAKGLNTLTIGEYRSSAFTLTDGQVAPLQITNSGRLKVDAEITAGVSNQIQVKNSSGTSIDVSWEQGENRMPIPVGIVDAYNFQNAANVDASGRLQVMIPPPATPEGKTRVVKTEYSNLDGTQDNVYVIPNGETLTLQRFNAGGECDSDTGNVVELWYDPNGNGADMEIIDVIFCSGTSSQHDLNVDYVGDGVKAIRMRRKRLSGGAKWVFGRWEGFY